MASSIDQSSPTPLKGKLTQVKYLLDDANERLLEEASKYDIFTTKTSASTLRQPGAQNEHDVPNNLIRTISDISTLKSVLSCPIFNRIVNVTDSLDKLSYHLNLHPSIGPSDINIDANGELILAPPIEPTSLNNFINNKLDSDFSDHSNNSPQIINTTNLIQQGNNKSILAEQSQHQIGQLNTNFTNTTELACSNNGYAKMQREQASNLINQQQYDSQANQNYVPSPNIDTSLKAYDVEKLVSNGNGVVVYANSNKPKRHHDMDTDMERNGDEGHRLYKSNGRMALDQVSNDNLNIRSDFRSTKSMNQIGEQENDPRRIGYSNELYKTTHELSQPGAISMQTTQSNGHNYNLYLKNDSQSHNVLSSTNGRAQSIQSSGIQYNRGSCSPSTSAGSTVRLADECDSGASSYQSHTAKVPQCPSYPYNNGSNNKSNGPQNNESRVEVEATSNEDRVDSMEQELIDNISPDMERIRVTLEKDRNGLGITIAGYTCEKEEISGIFIKSITPGSPADRSGKIRTLDQIFAVNGRELLGYSNPEAVNVLRQTGKVVTLELMRYLTESKYRKLQSELAHAVPALSTNNSRPASSSDNTSVQDVSHAQSSNVSVSPTRSSIPVSKIRENFQPPSPTKPAGSVAPKSTFVQVSSAEQPAGSQETEAIYKNDIAPNKVAAITATKNTTPKQSYSQSGNSLNTIGTPSQIPVAAQRGGTNKVIETKQGARNTIDIKSPACQTTTATYVNKISDIEFSDSTKKSVKDAPFAPIHSDEFGRLIGSEDIEWEKDAQIIEIYKENSQGLGFTVKDYANPKDPQQSIIMVTSITDGGVAQRDGRLSSGDLLIFVDDTNLEGASLQETVKALKRTNGQVRLGVLKYKPKRN